ncbi:ADP ribosylation factor like GTPase 3%2C like 1 isoform X2 [Xyrichtys novacula]|uniref:ADP ribosylation factor like GTPase 3, like 1 isoform X2 n=1 Tax=Xyrichtys novacula TaxID=13765 RepID=A0AAV1FDP5_XYRNO|nr:ADP ribosylation factor like GTPase 3%2C like 1 isoform X2 [Xyrichtys novacula]
MVMREILLCLLLDLYHTACFASSSLPAQCLICNSTEATLSASKEPGGCKNDFKVWINSTGSEAQEGDDVTLTCVHNLPNVTLMFGWTKDGEVLSEGHNKSQLVFLKVLSNKKGQYCCFVNSTCGYYKSLPHDVTVNGNGVVIMIICGVSALALVLLLGATMKYKLKRDNAKHKERMRQRAQNQQSAAPAPFTPRES